MTSETHSDNSTITKKVIANVPRAGLLAIPWVGSALEKAIFGPLDDRAREAERKQVQECLNELRIDVRFAQASLEDQVTILAEKVDKMTEEVRDLGPLNWSERVLGGNGHKAVPELEEV